MPLPEPNSGENKDEFLSRCMSDEKMKQEYSNNAQRYAVCNAIFKEKKNESKKNSRKAIRKGA